MLEDHSSNCPGFARVLGCKMHWQSYMTKHVSGVEYVATALQVFHLYSAALSGAQHGHRHVQIPWGSLSQ